MSYFIYETRYNKDYEGHFISEEEFLNLNKLIKTYRETFKELMQKTKPLAFKDLIELNNKVCCHDLEHDSLRTKDEV